MTSGWRAVLQIDAPYRTGCVLFEPVRLAGPVHIVVQTDQATLEPLARSLFARLQESLKALAPPPQQPSQCCRMPGIHCAARSDAACRSVLVVLAGPTRVSLPIEQLMRDWTAKRPLNSVVLPILPAGVSPAAVFPDPLDKLIALFDYGAIELLVPDILRAAGIGGSEHRLFISYRRDDVEELAEQLHDAFTHAGFHVFLDRFRGAPGASFPPLLRRELAGKGVVLVIESAQIATSKWTLAEVAFARALRLGLLALHLPRAPKFSMIPAADRITPAGWVRFPFVRPRLGRGGLRKVVDFVRARYAVQSLHRQLYLENLLHRALARHGLSAAAMGGGAFTVGDHAVQLSPRLPELAEVRSAVTHAQPYGRGVVVGAARLLPEEDRADLQWLAGQVGASMHSVGRLLRLAKALAAGRVLP
jgi:TIR domain